MGMECGTYAAGASSASVRGVRDRRRRWAKGSRVGYWDGGGLSIETMNAGGRGGGAKGEVKTPIRSRVGESDRMMEGGRLLAFKSRVSTSTFVKVEVLLVWL